MNARDFAGAAVELALELIVSDQRIAIRIPAAEQVPSHAWWNSERFYLIKQRAAVVTDASALWLSGR